MKGEAWWSGNKWGRFSRAARDELKRSNAYVAISIFDDDPETGRAHRRGSLFRACHAVVLDDVGTRASPQDVRLPLPSWKLETSPGNFQWGYILDPTERDAHRVEAMLKNLKARGWTDPGMMSVARYMRLPEGMNKKAKYGPDGFRCAMREWRP